MKAGFPFLAFAKTEVFHEFSGGVAEPNRDRFVHSLIGEVESGIPSVGGGTRFFRKSEGGGGMGEHEARFGHADALDGLKTSGGETQGAVSGEANILRGENDHAAGDKLWVFAGSDHASEIIKGGVNVGAAHGFNESRNRVIMFVALFVVAGELFAGSLDDGVFGDFIGERKSEL